MVAIFLIGFAFLMAAVALLVRTVTLPRTRMSAQLRQIRTYGFNAEVIEKPRREPAPSEPGLAGVASRIGHWAIRHFPQLKPLTRGELAAGGARTISAETFHGYRVIGTFGIPALIILLALASGNVSLVTFALVVVSALCAWVLPMSLIRRRGRTRLNEIDRDLPELVDVLTATIEAGLGFGGSLQLVTDRFDGPLGEELRFTLREQAMGLSTERALTNLSSRCETPSVRSFVRAVLQGESLGVSVGQIMRGLAVETRKRRRQAAYEKVQKAPVKLLFPLVFLIFPALLIVLLYPAVHVLLTSLG